MRATRFFRWGACSYNKLKFDNVILALFRVILFVLTEEKSTTQYLQPPVLQHNKSFSDMDNLTALRQHLL